MRGWQRHTANLRTDTRAGQVDMGKYAVVAQRHCQRKCALGANVCVTQVQPVGDGKLVGRWPEHGSGRRRLHPRMPGDGDSGNESCCVFVQQKQRLAVLGRADAI